MTERLETVNLVIATLYGRAADAARALKRSRTAIWKYIQRDMLPGDLYPDIQARAKTMNCEVADELFTSVAVHPSTIVRAGEKE
jgi:hypothetical protein